jgi:hypothetical protein
MKSRGAGNLSYLAALLLLFAAFSPALPLEPANAVPGQQTSPSDAKKVPIYISDFELFSSATSQPKRSDGTLAHRPADPVFADTDPATVQARRVIDAFANTLVELFQKSGYTAARVPGNPPSSGVLLRGVFAEPDAKNHIRRAMLGGGSPGPTFLLYVASFNLSHQDQPLYLPAPVQSPDSHYGPVITLNAYIPMVKYELPKDPSAQDVQKICAQIVSQLTDLLVANPNATPK